MKKLHKFTGTVVKHVYYDVLVEIECDPDNMPSEKEIADQMELQVTSGFEEPQEWEHSFEDIRLVH